MSVLQTDPTEEPDQLTRSAMSLDTHVLVDVVDSSDCLVKAKAQVMTRDDGTGLWHPLLGGGMSMVALSRVSQRFVDITTDPCHSECIQYCIEGRKMDSKVIVLRCFVTKELEYTSATPTFHHWVTKTDRFGLVFQTSPEATEFKKVVCRTVKELCSDPKQRLHESIKLEIVTSNVPSSVVEKTEVGKLLVRTTSDVPEAALLHAVVPPSCKELGHEATSCGNAESSDSISMSPLQDVVPAVPPRKALPSATLDVTSKPFDELFRVVPHSTQFDHSVPVSCNWPPQVVRLANSFHVSGTSGKLSGSSSFQQSSDSPPVPPRPDIVRSESSRPAVSVAVNRPASAVKTLGHMQSLSGMARSNRERSTLLSTQLAPTPAPGLLQQPPVSTPSGTNNYVYFTEGNVAPPTSAVAVKEAKPKDTWSEGSGATGGVPRRLAEASFHYSTGSDGNVRCEDAAGGAYVRLASPSDGTTVSQGHEYCYPSLDMVMPPASSNATHSSSSSHHRNTASPPPLPTKSKLNWRDCRRKRKQVQQRGQTPQRGLASVTRLSYGTGGVNQMQRRPATASAVVGSSHLSLDGSLENQSTRRARASSLLCLLPCTGRPCPQ